MTLTMPPPPVEIIAHRGAAHAAPENTRASISLAWQEGADAVEIDVRLTRDGRVVVIHDVDTLRVTGEHHVVAESTFDRLRQLDVGTWKGANWAGETIPLLDEILESVPPAGRLWVEVKCGVEILPALVPLLADARRANTRLVVASYDVEVLSGLKQALPEVPAFLVARFDRIEPEGPWSPTGAELLATARRARLDGLLLREVGPLDAVMCRAILDAGLGLYVWAVDDPDRARQLISLGARGIVTNRPSWLRRQLLLPEDS